MYNIKMHKSVILDWLLNLIALFNFRQTQEYLSLHRYLFMCNIMYDLIYRS